MVAVPRQETIRSEFVKRPGFILSLGAGAKEQKATPTEGASGKRERKQALGGK